MPRAGSLPVLAAFFFLHPQPSPWNLRLLSRWLWRGWVHGWGSSDTAVRKAVNIVNPIKGRPDAAPSEYEAVRDLVASVPGHPPAPLPLIEFRTDKATSRLILLALASLRPTDRDGVPLDLAAALDERGVKVVTEFVPDWRSHAAARGFWPDPEYTQVREARSEVLASHLIDAETVALLDDPEMFVRRRSPALVRLVANFLVNKVEAGALVRPPLEDLVASGNAEDD
jgi:hypothetical protein